MNELAENILDIAVENHASDIFIFPNSTGYELKLRTSLGLRQVKEIDYKTGKELLNYFKFQAQMDIAEHRRPQVGAYQTLINSENVFLRFSSIGEFSGYESLVIRLIYGEKSNYYFFPEQLELLTALTRQRGLIITSGPTGSGKTSSMYELAGIAGKDKVVMTIEDPVEVWNLNFYKLKLI